MVLEQRKMGREIKLAAVMTVCVALFISLFLIYSREKSQEINAVRTELRTARADLRAALNRLEETAMENRALIREDCHRTNEARAKANRELRRPLKDMLGYFVLLIDQSIAQRRREGRAIPKTTLESRAKFQNFYNRVTLQPQLVCTLS